MDYYHLYLSDLVKNPIRIKELDILAATSPFDSYENLSVHYFDYVENETEITCILTSPIFLISKEVKDLFSLYNTSMKFKGIQLFTTKKDEAITPLYYIPDIPKVDCLDKKVRINPNGTINTILLDYHKMKGDPIFRLDHLAQQVIVVNEDVAESLLRRNLFGIGLTKVEVLD